MAQCSDVSSPETLPPLRRTRWRCKTPPISPTRVETSYASRPVRLAARTSSTPAPPPPRWLRGPGTLSFDDESASGAESCGDSRVALTFCFPNFKASSLLPLKLPLSARSPPESAPEWPRSAALERVLVVLEWALVALEWVLGALEQALAGLRWALAGLGQAPVALADPLSPTRAVLVASVALPLPLLAARRGLPARGGRGFSPALAPPA